MSLPRPHPSVVTVLAINAAWILIAAVSSPSFPLAEIIWGGSTRTIEGSRIEVAEVIALVAYIPLWLWAGWRMHRARGWGREVVLALAMAIQIVVLIGEELDWLGALAPYRNLRDFIRMVLPDVFDSPAAAGYVLLFLLVPALPLRDVQAWLERAAPVRAEPGDSLATVLCIALTLVVYPLVGDQELGELHQVGIYTVLGIVTARVARRAARVGARRDG